MVDKNILDQVSHLSSAKRALLQRILQKRVASSDELKGIRPRPKGSSIPLSYAQQQLWVFNQLMPESPVYNIPTAIRLTGIMNVEALRNSLAEIQRRHEVLRTVFPSLEGQPVQVILPEPDFKLPQIDLTELAEANRACQAGLLMNGDAQRIFNLERGPLFRASLLRLAEEDFLLLLTVHHIVSDGWSMGIITRELGALYDAFSSGFPSPLPEMAIQYADYAVWQREWVEREGLDGRLAYWKRQLDGAPAVLELPADGPRPEAQTLRGANFQFLLPTKISDGLRQLSQQEGATLFMTLLTGFLALLCRYTGQEDICVGTPIAGRNRVETERLIGFFVNTLVLRADLRGGPSYRQLLGRIRKVVLDAFENQEVPFEKLVEELAPERSLSHTPLFQVMFVLQNIPRQMVRLPQVTLSGVHAELGTSMFDLSLTAVESGNAIGATLEYSTDLFNKETIARLRHHLETLLEDMVSNPDKSILETSLLSGKEKHQLLVEWNSRHLEAAGDETIGALIEQQAQLTPDAIAVVYEQDRISYRELNRRANQVAHYLRAKGAAPEVLVGICAEKSIEMMVGLLGIIKSGGVYVPLDPMYPSKRLAFILADTQLGLLLTQDGLLEKLPEHNAQVVCLDSNWEAIALESDANPVSAVTAHNLAYVTYTSGSTGRPKGSMISQRSLVNAYRAWQADYALRSLATCHLQMASFSFDVFSGDLVRALCSGAKLVLCPRDLLLDAKELYELMRRESVDAAEFVPAVLRNLIHYLQESAQSLDFMRLLIVGSDSWHIGEYNEFCRHCGPQTRLINSYGVTESTIDSSFFEGSLGSLPVEGMVPIGRPFPGTQLYILDRQMEPVPTGIPAELYIGGEGLARAYINRPAMTAERFAPNPHGDKPGARLYKTGDLARYLPDGNIELLGRIDRQVKIRGFRIELGEIEDVLSQHPAVRESVVIAREDVPGDRRLVAYTTVNAHCKELTEELSEDELYDEHISQWKAVFDDLYEEKSIDSNLAFNIRGWNSSYTGQPIPESEVREWMDQTVDRILSLEPKSVLEIGCGSGLMLFRIGPHCTRYCATDISSHTLELVKRQMTMFDGQLPPVEFLQRSGNDFSGVEEDSFDAVLIVSVAQYFPNVNYFLEVLEGAMNAVKPGGFIFVGDVRNLLLLEAFHTSVQISSAHEALPKDELQKRVNRQLLRENQLAVDPAFFTSLKKHLPKISHTEILLERGKHLNELSKFRFDAIIHAVPNSHPRFQTQPFDWNKNELTLASVRQWLEERDPEVLGLTHVPNARVIEDVKAVDLMKKHEALKSVEDIKTALQIDREAGVHPERFWEMADDLPYEVKISWDNCDAEGHYDVVFIRNQAGSNGVEARNVVVQSDDDPPVRPWNNYANDPLHGLVSGKIVPVLQEYLKERVPDYMVPSAFVVLDTFPLTPNGKVDRQALPAASWTPIEKTYVAPRTPLEEQLAEIWANLLMVDRVGVHDNFFELGGHSLLATQVISRVRKTFDTEIAVKRLFESPTVGELADIIQQVRTQSQPALSTAIARVSRDRNLPLSYAQQRLWFIDQLEPGSALYNMPDFIQMRGEIEQWAVEQSLSEIVRRHEVLRTSFPSEGGAARQQINPAESIKVPVIELSEVAPPERLLAESRRVSGLVVDEPFDLARGPLLRARLIRLSREHQVLCVTTHHIVSDGWSSTILKRELAALYESYRKGEEAGLEELPIQYADYAVWQREQLRGDELEKQLAYWRQQLAGSRGVLELPADRARPAEQSYRGARVGMVIEEEVSRKLRALSRGEQVTLYMNLLAAVGVMLSRYSGETDLCIGTPVAGRGRVELEGLIGLFVNTVVMRLKIDEGESYRRLLAKVRGVVIEGYENQEAPFERIVEELEPERSLSHSPLFQVMFVMQNVPGEEVELGGVRIGEQEAEEGRAMFDLTVTMTESKSGEIVGSLEYNRDLYEAETIKRMLKHYHSLLSAIVAYPDEKIRSLPLLDAEERYQILHQWNDTAIAYPDECVHQLFEAQVERTPDAIALSFEQEQLSYAELNRRANQLAHYLRGRGVGLESPVGICLERSIDMIVGLFGTLKAGAAYLPLDPSYPRPRLEFILADANSPVVITRRAEAGNLPERRSETVFIDAQWADISMNSDANPEVAVSPANLAYIIYTSGSTGKPKGAMLAHRGVCNRLLWMQREYELTQADSVLQKTPFSFDVSVWEFFWPLMTGAHLVIAEPGGHQDSHYLVDLISKEKITTVHFVPSMLQAFLQEASVDQCESLRNVICSGEALSPESVKRFTERMKAELSNLYGPTEASVDVTYWRCEREDRRGNVPIGRPIDNIQIYILDEHLQPTVIGRPAELHIGGVGLARGYLNRPDLTAERFIPDPFSREPGARLYKTGDLARYSSGGEIDFAGRIDHQVKVRGHRIELGEIETAFSQHEAVREAVVVLREDSAAQKRLVVYLVARSDNTPDITELRKFLKERLPEYMVPSAWVFLDEFPLTPNGKLDRRALPAPEQKSANRSRSASADTNPIEEVLAGIWAEVLGIDPPRRDDNFFELGGHSLLATQVISRVRLAFQTEIAVKRLFEAQTIGELAEIIQKARTESHPALSTAIAKVSRDRSLPLSYAQQRLWFIDQLEPGSPLYNMPAFIQMRGEIDHRAVEQGLSQIVGRHEVLRTSFPSDGGTAHQQIHAAEAVHVPVIELSEVAPERLLAESRRVSRLVVDEPFDLGREPLLRARLIRLSREHQVLCVTTHHIVSDGWSSTILKRELAALYESYRKGEESGLEELPIQYADYAVWQREQLQGEALEKQLGYWRQQLAGSRGVLEMPSDRARPAEQSYRGASVGMEIEAEVSRKLRALSRGEQVTLNMSLLAALGVVLSRYSGESDLCIGTPVAGRGRVELEGLIGLFVNTVVMRLKIGEGESYRGLLAKVREVVIEGYENQEAPFERVVEELEPERSLSHSPLFQVMFVMQNVPGGEVDVGGVRIDEQEAEEGRAMFDLTVTMTESKGGEIVGSLEYNRDLYDEWRIRRMSQHLKRVIEAMVEDVEASVSETQLLSEQELQQVVVEWNDTRKENETTRTIVEIIERQAEEREEAVAVKYEGERITYGELNRRANQLAHYLRREGVGAETIVGICMKRSIEMVVGLLGVLKSGAAYLPLDPAYPKQRLALMLEDARVSVLLTQLQLKDHIASPGCRIVCLDSDWSIIAQHRQSNPLDIAEPEQLAYVIYTSGTTGNPRGVLISHRSLSNHCNAIHKEYDLSSEDRVLQFASIGFDVAAEELFPAWKAGATVVLRPPHMLDSFQDFFEGLGRDRLTVLNLPMAYWHELVAELALSRVTLPDCVRLVIAGSDKANTQSFATWRKVVGDGVRLCNAYGPTEATITSTIYDARGLQPDAEITSIPIGRPLANTEVSILDNHLQPVPVGVAGELHISGEGLSRGYLNNADLTGEKFIPHPCSDKPGSRMYRTGDLARYLPDGQIEFLGRCDNQVKVRGFRIELSEIEACLSKHPAIRNAVVDARTTSEGQEVLVGYIVLNASQEITGAQLRNHLKERLPDYMVPTIYVALEALPTTASGKIDRRALPTPNWESIRREHVAPRTETEELLAEIFGKVLHIEKIGIHDDFFDLGGHSLLATQVVSRVREAFEIDFPLRALFESPTIEGLALAIVQQQAEQTDSEILAEILAELEPLRADEVQSILSGD